MQTFLGYGDNSNSDLFRKSGLPEELVGACAQFSWQRQPDSQ